MEEQTNTPSTPTPAANPVASSPSPVVKKNRFAFLKNKKFWFIATPIILILAGGITWAVVGNKTTESVTEPAAETPAIVANTFSLLNGENVKPEVANRRVVATMIENSPDARPQVGLVQADMVYEAVVEGGITRFMALYQQTQPEKVGPVRSARSYYIDWLSEMDAIYMHAGGSPTALARIGEYGIKDYPHANDGTYWREPKAGVASEHTLFANVAKVFTNAVTNKKWSATNDFKTWLFKDAVVPSTAVATTTTVNFTTANYQAAWLFDPITNTYARSLAGVAHKDRVSNEQIKATNIAVMTVERSANAPYAGTGKESEWSMTTIGTGKASVFFDGSRTDGTW